VNDLVKQATFELGRPNLCVAIAISIQGYSFYGAAILVNRVRELRNLFIY
jgi:hypothetical protein